MLFIGKRARGSTKPHAGFVVFLPILERSDVAYATGCDRPRILFGFREREKLLSEREDTVYG
jgi:hypothetical protein